MRKIKRIDVLAALLAMAIVAIPFRTRVWRIFVSGVQIVKGKATVADRVQEYGAQVRERLTPFFTAAAVAYPPAKVILVGLKEERMLEVWAAAPDGTFVFVRKYPILGTSGELGPKLEEGDRQVPEGLYRIESLNPNSRFHLSLRLNYPNEFDRKHAKQEGRTHPGSDIMIHGNTCSIGCLAMGDEAAEDLFVLAAESGIDTMSVILSPVDFRTREMPEQNGDLPKWTRELYRDIRRELSQLERKADGDCVADLAQLLLDRDNSVRRNAADVLRPMGEKAVPALLRVATIEQRQPYTEVSARSVLFEIGKDGVPALVMALASGNSAIRSLAARALARIGSEAAAAVDTLIRLTQTDQDENVRRLAAYALGAIGREPDKVIPVLINAIHDTSDVRGSALGGLAKFGTAAIPSLFQVLRTADRETCGKIGVALGWMEPEAVHAISEGLRDDHENVRSYCAYGLGRMKAKSAIPDLIEALHDRVIDVRLRALAALGEIGPDAQEIVPELLRYLHDENWATRATAASALGKIGPVNEEMIPGIATLLDDETVNVRRSAIGALGRIGVHSSDVIPLLTTALREQENDDLRACAANALRYMGPEAVAAVPELVKALEDTDSYVRRQVLYALGEIGPGAEDAVPAIERFLEDEDYQIREHAKGAVYKIMVRRPHIPERGDP